MIVYDFSLLLNEINFDPIENLCKNQETNSAYEYFINRITEAYEKAFPKRNNSNKRNQKSNQPWMTKGILKATKVTSNLYLKYIKNPTTNNKNKFIQYRNLFKTVKEKTKKPILHQSFQSIIMI